MVCNSPISSGRWGMKSWVLMAQLAYSGFTVDIFKSTCEAIPVLSSFTIVMEDNSFQIKSTFPELSFLSPPSLPPQPTNPRNYVPTNLKKFDKPRKLAPTNFNDSTVYVLTFLVFTGKLSLFLWNTLNDINIYTENREKKTCTSKTGKRVS